MTDKLQKSISAAIRRLRQDRRWNQAELAKTLGVSQSRLSEIESGKGSISAEQLIILMQTFNVPLSHFVKTKPADPDAQLRNAISRLGGSQLIENPDVLPSEKLNEVSTVITETLISGISSRLITNLVPTIVNNIRNFSFIRTLIKLKEYGLQNRLFWIADGLLWALNKRLSIFVPKDRLLLYRQAKTVLENFFNPQLLCAYTYNLQEDILDPDITSQKTLEQTKKSRDDIAKKWRIVTRITADDFYQSLLAAEQNG